VENRCVVLAAELLTDFGQRGGSKLFHKEHGNLPREGNHTGIAPHFQVLRAQTEVLTDGAL
jgi:hypothetical protein